MLLSEIPPAHLTPGALHEVGKAVFGTADVSVAKALPLMSKAAPSSSFGVWRVTLCHGAEKRDVVFKLCGNDLDETESCLVGSSDDMASWQYWEREPIAYETPRALEALTVGQYLHFLDCYHVTPTRSIEAGGRIFKTRGMWLEHLKIDRLEHPIPLYESAARLLGIRDANMIVRGFFPTSQSQIPFAMHRHWMARRCHRASDEDRARRGGYEPTVWRHTPGLSDEQAKLFAVAAEMWQRREQLYEIASKSMHMLNLGDFHRGNFDAVVRPDKRISMVVFDLSSVGEYPVGEDLMGLTYTASHLTHGWNGDVDPMSPRTVVEHLYGLYVESISRRMNDLGIGGSVSTILPQVRQNMAIGWARKASLAGDMRDPRFMTHHGGGNSTRLVPAMIRGIELAVSFENEAFAVPSFVRSSRNVATENAVL